MSDDWDPETKALHAGQEEPDPATGARAPPIYQTTSYVFEDAADAAAQFALEKPGHIYSRLMNPTNAVLEERVAADNPAYHGVNFEERFGEAAFTYAAVARGLRDLGNQQAPFDAWNTAQGLESLPRRMPRHCENAMAVAEHLEDHPAVSWVSYPGLDSHETHEEASEYLEGGYGGMVTFGLEAGYDAARETVESTEIASLLANVGDSKTLIIHPASTTHQQLSDEEQAAAGVTDDMVRLSVGLES